MSLWCHEYGLSRGLWLFGLLPRSLQLKLTLYKYHNQHILQRLNWVRLALTRPTSQWRIEMKASWKHLRLSFKNRCQQNTVLMIGSWLRHAYLHKWSRIDEHRPRNLKDSLCHLTLSLQRRVNYWNWEKEQTRCVLDITCLETKLYSYTIINNRKCHQILYY